MAFQIRTLKSDSRATAGALTYTVPANYRATIKNFAAYVLSAANADTFKVTASIAGKTHVLSVLVTATAGAQIGFFTSQNSYNASNVAGTGTAVGGAFFSVLANNLTLEAGDSITITSTGGASTMSLSISGVLENV